MINDNDDNDDRGEDDGNDCHGERDGALNTAIILYLKSLILKYRTFLNYETDS